MKNWIYILSFLLIAGCAMDDDFLEDLTEKPLVEFKLNISNHKNEYNLGDTIWIESEIANETNNLLTNEMLIIDNPTVLMSGIINKLQSYADSIDFIAENFQVVERFGQVEFTNVLDNEQSSFVFNIIYGQPLENNKLQLGFICNYPGVFAFESEGTLYYGANRTNYENLNEENSELANVYYTFDMEDINENVFTSLPADYYGYYKNFYYSDLIEAKRYYFIKVSVE